MDQEAKRDEEGVTAFDWLLVLAENFKFLAIGTILIALGAFAIAQFLTPQYASQAILLLPAPRESPFSSDSLEPVASPMQVRSIMVSPAILDPVIAALGLADGRPMERARNELAELVNVTVSKDGLLLMQVTHSAPRMAQAIGNAMIDAWLRTTLPSEQRRIELEERLAIAKSVLSLNAGGVQSGGSARVLPEGARFSAGFAAGALGARYFDEVARVPGILRGVTRDVVKLAPTLPTEKVTPDVARITILSAMFGFFALLLSVLLRHSWIGATQNPLTAKKWGRLLVAIGFRSPSAD